MNSMCRARERVVSRLEASSVTQRRDATPANRDSATAMSLAGTPEHASSRRSTAPMPLRKSLELEGSSLPFSFSTPSPSLSFRAKSLTANQSAAARATRPGFAPTTTEREESNRTATPAHRRALLSPILPLQTLNTRSALASPNWRRRPRRFDGPRCFSGLDAVVDSAANRHDELESSAPWHWRQRERRGRTKAPETTQAPASTARHSAQDTRRTCRATRKLAPWTEASQDQQRKASSESQ